MRNQMRTTKLSTFSQFKNAADADIAFLNCAQENMAVDGETMTKELDSLTQTQLALESILEGLYDIKQKGKGLGIENARFVQICIGDIGARLGVDRPVISLESVTTDGMRLDMAMEGVVEYISAILKSKLSLFVWAADFIFQFFDNSKAKFVKIKTELEKVIHEYEMYGVSEKEKIEGNFGDSLFKSTDTNTSNSTIIKNLQQYLTKINDPAKTKAMDDILSAADDVINKVRDNWFFSSSRDARYIEKNRQKMRSALISFVETENDIIGQGKYTTEFDDKGTPSLKRVVLSKENKTNIFTPLDKSEFEKIKKQLIDIVSRGSELTDYYIRESKKARSLYGYSGINGILRLGPKILKAMASFVAGPIAAAGAAAIPSRDIFQAMMFSNYMDVLRVYMYHDAQQREKILTDAMTLIRKSTA